MVTVILRVAVFSLFLSATMSAIADSKIAVLDFELLNLTMKLSDPKKVAEIDAKDQQNVALIGSYLKQGLANSEGYSLVDISEQARSEADKGIGYLFDCAECSAELGRAHNSDYIVVGRLHKPTYLFSYIIVRIFDTKTNSLVKEFRSEVKGIPERSIPGAVANLVHKINKIIPH
ncbi:MAG: DUF3280 domain-containing protein [Gammaproteobacteria bacterium]|nr:DUF3280 domain-containing protein [Gammaproteobacteria bacterium]